MYKLHQYQQVKSRGVSVNAKISLVVPHWPVKPEHDDMLLRCIKSIDADEKIVVVNEGTGMGKAINQGLRLTTGDFIIVSNNDCTFSGGDIRDMCDIECITIPNNMPGQGDLPRAFYCMPRWIYEKVGGYDERFKVGYFEDDDMILRWEKAEIDIRMINNVYVDHNPGTTLNNMPDRIAIYEENKRLFDDKWANG